VTQFCVEKEIVPQAPLIGYGHEWSVPENGGVISYVFDPSYMQDAQTKGVYVKEMVLPSDK